MVRRFILVSATLLCCFTNASAIDLTNKTEISTAASFQHMSARGNTRSILNVPLRIGTFISPKVSLEGELVGTFPKGSDAGIMFSGSALYHFQSGERLFNFILFGAGVANTVPLAGNITSGGVDETGSFVQIGLGMKSFLGDKVALRMEYRYQRFAFENIALHYHTIFTGLSVFL